MKNNLEESETHVCSIDLNGAMNTSMIVKSVANTEVGRNY